MAAVATQSETTTPWLQVKALNSFLVGDGEGSNMAADGSEWGFDVGAAATGVRLVGTSPPPGVCREVGVGVTTSCCSGVGPIDAETGLGAPGVGLEAGGSVPASCGGMVGPICIDACFCVGFSFIFPLVPSAVASLF
jgi:hypothetical protein